MTDKQIIIYKKECYNEPYCSLNQVLEQLKAKEQKIEKIQEILDIYYDDDWKATREIQKLIRE